MPIRPSGSAMLKYFPFGGRIWGAGGAAEVLNIPPTTLKSKMKKLGIHKENVE